MRLKTEIWLRAYLHQCTVKAIPFYVVYRGDPDFGTVILRLNLLDGRNRMLVQATAPDGEDGWMDAHHGQELTNREADAYIEKQTDIDPDAWVIEIEHAEGWHPFPGEMI